MLSVPEAACPLIPVTYVHAAYTSAEESVRVNLGFRRAIFDLSPQLVATRIERNDLVIHPQVGLPLGWRFRELAEIGPVTSAVGSNYRYNSEFTVARALGKNSELYSVEILNEGSGVSIDDAVTEMQATFVARMIDPWQAVASKFPVLISGADQGFPFPPLFSLPRARLSVARPLAGRVQKRCAHSS